MEARQTLTGSSVPKGLVVMLAISAAIALAIGGSLIAKDFAGSNAAVNGSVHAAPGTVLRQDNPVQAAPAHAAPGTVLRQDSSVQAGPALIDRGAERQSGAPAGTHIGRSSGTQSVDGSDATVKAPKQNVDQMPGFRA